MLFFHLRIGKTKEGNRNEEKAKHEDHLTWWPVEQEYRGVSAEAE